MTVHDKPVVPEQADHSLAEARAAVGVTGEPGASLRGGGLVGASASLLAAACWGPLARLVVDRHAIALEVGVEPSAIDDRVVRILLLAVLVAVVQALVSRARAMTATRLGLAGGAAVVAGVLLATDLYSASQDIARLDIVAILGALALGLSVPTLAAALSSRVAPTARVASLQVAAGGLPLAMLVAGAGVVVGSAGGASLVLAALAIAGAPATFRMRGVDAGLDQAAVHEQADTPVAPVPAVAFAQVVRRLLSRASFVHASLIAFASGIVLTALPMFTMIRLQHDFLADGADQAFAVMAAHGLLVLLLVLGVRHVAVAHGKSVGGPGWGVNVLLVTAAASLVAGMSVRSDVALLAGGAVATALLWWSWVRTELVLLVSTPHDLRQWAGTAMAVMQAMGGVIILVVAAGVDRRFGTTWALTFCAVPIAAVAAAAGRLTESAPRDLDRTLRQFLGAVEISQRRAAGAPVPLLEARDVNFSYGQVQVLFGVDFTVDEGEMVALLGTNGAGKSTLLRVLSGLGLPSRGLVRFQGRDITFASPGDRVHLGITQVPGGKAVFGPLTVLENLRIHGHALGRDRAAVEQGIEAAFAQFPRLAERKDQPGQTLSGGEQQMLALSKALILRPKLLLIDELSLGLAPVIVGQLLDMVRRINAEGTAVVLVEQSVNVALSLVNHAYYLEKGEVRFDGRAKDLLLRPDVLRSVYLKGAAQGLGGGA